jgi:phosphoesterase RecJ-like protein
MSNVIENINEFLPKLSEKRKIVITAHTKPDADAVGSSLGLKLAFDKLGHDVVVIMPNDYPSFIKWMPANDQVKIHEGNESLCDDIISSADIIIHNDYSGLKRSEGMEAVLRRANGIKVVIDHHLEPENFADFYLWDPKASSTCELVYRLIRLISAEDLLDTDIASCLYAGIMTDTGSFRFPSTSKAVHLILAELLDAGIDHSKIHRLVYDDNDLDRLRLLGFCLSERLTVITDLKTAYITLSQEDLARFNYRQGDTEGIVNYALSVSGITFAAIFMEKEGSVKMSFRSVGTFNASDFAKKHFNGGGHKNAAGGNTDAPFQTVINDFKRILPSYEKELINSDC